MASGRTIDVKPGDGVRYVVPQRIACGKNVSLAFRVTQPSRDRVIEVCAGNKIIKARSVRRLHPAEMVWVEMGDIDMTCADTLEVRVK